MKNITKRGFTLVEIVTVLAIISVLSALVVGTFNIARQTSYDNERKADLKTAQLALVVYHSKFGNWMETGSGYGSGGSGLGWFNYVGGAYVKSIAQGLADAGLTKELIMDPTKGTYSTPTDGRYTYMKYHCVVAGTTKVYLYAKLAGIPQSSTAADGTCCATCDSSYGMNYVLEVN